MAERKDIKMRDLHGQLTEAQAKYVEDKGIIDAVLEDWGHNVYRHDDLEGVEVHVELDKDGKIINFEVVEKGQWRRSIIFEDEGTYGYGEFDYE